MSLVDQLVDAGSCSRLFIDGGSNMGESVTAFLKGAMYRCAVASPSRLYGKAWKNATRRTQLEWMSPLGRTSEWCIRSFDASPGIAAKLQQENTHGPNVRYIDAALGTHTSPKAPREIIRYSNHSFGLTTGAFSHYDLHLDKPPELEKWTHHGPSLDVREIIRRYKGTAKSIALKLDVEGHEFAILHALADEPELLCSIDYLFTEYHNLKFNATKYGWPEDLYARTGAKILNAMDNYPNCKLRINWRSFWSACGEPMKFLWMGSFQATGINKTAGGGRSG